MTTTNMSLNEPSVGQTAGPDWATEVNANFTTIDQHDHTSGKGVQLTPSALNINSDLEFNGNAAIELKRLTFDSSATGSGTNYSVYQSGGNLYWYNGSGQAVQITNGANVKTTGGSIDGMSGTDAQVLYGSGIYRFEFDTTLSPFSGAKMAHGDILLYKYDGSSGSDAYVILKYTGSSAGSNNITVPDETGTMLTTSTSYGGNISIAATGGSNTITLDAANDINLTATADVNLPNNVGLVFGDDGEKIEGDGTDLTIASSGEININSGTLDLSAQTVDVTLNNAVDALNFDSNTLIIDASNNRVGIGKTPSFNLDVLDAAQISGAEGTSASLYLVADEGDDNGDGWRINSNQDVNDLTIANNTSGSYVDKLTLTSTGNLEIAGEATVTNKLNSSAGNSLTLQSPSNAAVIINTSGANERVRINSAGNVGIGVAPESVDTNYRALQVAGTAGLQGTASQAAGSIVALTNNVYRATDATWKYIVTDEASRYDQFDGTHVFRVAGSGSADATISFSDALTIANNKNVTIHDGNLVIGTGGHGIDFAAQTTSSASGVTPSTGADEVLDHYEVGTFEPAIALSTPSNSTCTEKKGTYCRIGDFVSIHGRCRFTKNSGSGNLVSITGLPFTSFTLSGYQSAGSSASIGAGRSGYVERLRLDTGSDTIAYSFAPQSASSSGASITASDMDTDFYVRFSLQYRCAG